ncbi:MAG: 2-oxoacid:acceptor oxidoreductase family protein [Thermodesulfobacteriota bacterium]
MYESVIMAGYGGQGILLMGQLLCYAGMREGLHVTWMPSYGPEMRGGTANCTVILSTERIGSPVTHYPSSVIAMNKPSLDRFESTVTPGGLLIVNSSLVNKDHFRSDLQVVRVPANKIAEEIGSIQVTNMGALGAYIMAKKIVSLESAIAALPRMIPAHRQELLPINEKALRQGAEFVRQNI